MLCASDARALIQNTPFVPDNNFDHKIMIQFCKNIKILGLSKNFVQHSADFLYMESPKNVVRNVMSGKMCFKNVNNYLNTNIYSYLETSGGQSTNLFINVAHFFNTRFN